MQGANGAACTRSSKGPYDKHAVGISWEGENMKIPNSVWYGEPCVAENTKFRVERDSVCFRKIRNFVCRRGDAKDTKTRESV
jgi:hypothetical protein